MKGMTNASGSSAKPIPGQDIEQILGDILFPTAEELDFRFVDGGMIAGFSHSGWEKYQSGLLTTLEFPNTYVEGETVKIDKVFTNFSDFENDYENGGRYAFEYYDGGMWIEVIYPIFWEYQETEWDNIVNNIINNVGSFMIKEWRTSYYTGEGEFCLGVAGYAFYGFDNIKHIITPNRTEQDYFTVTERAFYSLGNLESFIIKEGFIAMDPLAIDMCHSLNYISEINGEIRANSINGCYSLNQLRLGSNLEILGESAVNSNYSLVEIYNLSGIDIEAEGYYTEYAKIIHTSMDEPSILVEANGHRFAYVDGVGYYVKYLGSDTQVVIPNNFTDNQGQERVVSEIIAYAISYNSMIDEIRVPSLVTQIGKGAMSHNDNLREIDLPAGVEVIDKWAFEYNPRLMIITLPVNITILESMLFNECTSLGHINLDELTQLTTIRNRVFKNTGLYEITIPENVTTITGKDLFKNCEHLTYVTFKPTTPPEVLTSTGLFENTPIERYINGEYVEETPVIYVPYGTLSAYQNATNLVAYASIMQEMEPEE